MSRGLISRIISEKSELTILDFRPANMIFCLRSVDDLDEEDVFDILGEQITSGSKVHPGLDTIPVVTVVLKYLVDKFDCREDVDP
jgi:hypothetical protein